MYTPYYPIKTRGNQVVFEDEEEIKRMRVQTMEP